MDSPPSPDEVLKLIEVLVLPSTPGTGIKEKSCNGNLDVQLQDNIIKAKEHLTECSSESYISVVLQNCIQHASIPSKHNDIHWKFTCWILALLKCLNVALKNAVATQQEHTKDKGKTRTPSGADAWSISQQKAVVTSIQFVVCLGVLPNLLPDVGLPLQKRSGFSHLLKQQSDCSSGTPELRPDIKREKLFFSVMALLELIETPTLGSIILSQHLGDLLASLCQLSCAPVKKDSSKSEKMSSASSAKGTKNYDHVKTHQRNGSDDRNDFCHQNDSEQGITVPYSENCWEDNHAIEQQLQKLVDRVYPPMLIKELMILQGGPRQSSTSNMGIALSPAPRWLRQVCSSLLIDVLTRPNGLQALLLSMSPPDQQGVIQDMDWKKCEAVAKIITNCPLRSRQEEYFSKICPQALKLTTGSKTSGPGPRIAALMLASLLKSHPSLAQKYFLEPLLQPLLHCVNFKGAVGEETIVADESGIVQCIETIHKVFVIGRDPQSPLLETLKEVIHPLFCIYLTTRQTVLAASKAVEEILLTFLKHVELSLALAGLKLMSFGSTCICDSEGSGIKLLPTCVIMVLADNGGVQAVSRSPQIGMETQLTDWTGQVDAVLSLLTSPSMKDLAVEFLLNLLQMLTGFIDEQIALEKESVSHQDPGYLFNCESSTTLDFGKIRRNLILMQLLAALSEKLGPSCLKKTAQILQFVKVTLERSVQVWSATREEQTREFETETLTMAMGLLTVVIGGEKQLSSSDREAIDSMLPHLQTISDSHPDPSVEEMATDLRIAISTRGAVWSEVLNNLAQKKEREAQSDNIKVKAEKKKKTANKREKSGVETCSKKPLIQVISSSEENKLVEGDGNCFAQNQESFELNPCLAVFQKQNKTSYSENSDTRTINPECDNKFEEGSLTAKSDDSFKNIKSEENALNNQSYSEPGTTEIDKGLEELCDILLPVRGHGLIRLRRAYERRDPDALVKVDLLLKVFLENLAHSDSYIYLAAVQGLAALSEHDPQRILPILLEKYCDKECNKPEKNARFTLKLGEVLVKTSKALGPMIPKYRECLLAAMLTGACHDDDLVRASAVSNLGEVCGLLRYSLGPVVHEIFECTSSLLKSDSSKEVRSAAVLVTTKLLQGLGQDTLKVLNSVLKDLYRLLKIAVTTEKEDSVKLHLQMALEVLDGIMRNFLFPEQRLEKHIHVLDAPEPGLLG